MSNATDALFHLEQAEQEPQIHLVAAQVHAILAVADRLETLGNLCDQIVRVQLNGGAYVQAR